MAEKHYFEQIRHTADYLVPYFRRYIPNFDTFRILEVGCAEGGGVKVFHDLGMQITGVDIAPGRVDLAKQKNPELDIRVMDITDVEIVDKLEKYDLIIMRDVIEHVPNRHATFSVISKLLKDTGYLYVTFPPRFSGFAGHQQNGRSIMRWMPYVQILPEIFIKGIGKLLNEKPNVIEGVAKNFRDGLTIRSFEKYYQSNAFQPIVKELFLFRPVFKIRFNLTPIKIPNFPIVREVLAFGCEYLLVKSV